jgi:hypothetical protein
MLSTLRVHTKAPHKNDLPRKRLRALKRPGRARTVKGRVGAVVGFADLGSGRIVVSEIEAPNMLVDTVRSGREAAQSGNATEPYADPPHGVHVRVVRQQQLRRATVSIGTRTSYSGARWEVRVEGSA